MTLRSPTYAAGVPHPLRALLAAALGCLLVVAAPGGAGAAGSARHDHGAHHGFTSGEARQVLHRARNLLQHGTRAEARPAPTDLTMVLRDLHLARPSLTGADRRAADRLLSRSYAADQAQAASGTAGLTVTCTTHFCVHYAAPTKSTWAQTTLSTL